MVCDAGVPYSITQHINVFCVKMIELCSSSLLDIIEHKVC